MRPAVVVMALAIVLVAVTWWLNSHSEIATTSPLPQPESAALEPRVAPSSAPPKVRRSADEAASRAKESAVVALPKPTATEVERVTRRVKTFRPSPPEQDFKDPIAPGHDAKAIRKISERFEAWTQAGVNENADVSYFGVRCDHPPCVMALQYNADRGSGFLDRAEAWLTKTGKAGKVQTFVHQIDADHSRMWAWYNPHPEASSARHQFDKRLLEQIREEVKALPDYNPSRDSAE